MAGEMLQQDILQGFAAKCREVGLSVTIPRQMVYEALRKRKDHPTADMIYNDLRVIAPQISRATVFRILDSLAGCGIVQRVMHPGAVARYDGVAEGHIHLICTRCGRILDWATAPFPTGSAIASGGEVDDVPEGFQVHGVVVNYYGLCRLCREAEETTTIREQ